MGNGAVTNALNPAWLVARRKRDRQNIISQTFLDV